MNKVLFSHNSDNWRTPSELHKRFLDLGYIDTFPFMAQYNEFDNLYSNKKLFCNPPYSKLNEVSEWLIKQYNNDNEIILLVPARTDTKWFHKLIMLSPAIYFIKGRLKFNDSNSAPFPSIIMYFNRKRALLPTYWVYQL